MQGAADLLIAFVKLRSAVFSRTTALVGSFTRSRPWFPQVRDGRDLSCGFSRCCPWWFGSYWSSSGSSTLA